MPVRGQPARGCRSGLFRRSHLEVIGVGRLIEAGVCVRLAAPASSCRAQCSNGRRRPARRWRTSATPAADAGPSPESGLVSAAETAHFGRLIGNDEGVIREGATWLACPTGRRPGSALSWRSSASLLSASPSSASPVPPPSSSPRCKRRQRAEPPLTRHLRGLRVHLRRGGLPGLCNGGKTKLGPTAARTPNDGVTAEARAYRTCAGRHPGSAWPISCASFLGLSPRKARTKGA